MSIRPQVVVTVDGKPVSGVFFEKLVSLTITDREGIRSDTLDMVFDDSFPHFGSPRRGAIVEVTMLTGIAGGFVGAFVIDRVEFRCLPYTITVKGHSADLQSEMKTNKTRHWDDKSVKDIITEIAGEYGLATKIAEAVSGHVYEWIGQQDESDMHFLERLAKRHAALFTIKNGTMLWLERGEGKTADGTAVPATAILPVSIVEGSCSVSETDVDRFATVKAYWHDKAGSKRRPVIVPADPEAKGEHVLSDPFASKEEAEAAAKAAAKEMMRGLVETTCTVNARPDLMAGQPITYAGVRPVVDGREFILDVVTHTFSKGAGLRTAFTGKAKAG